MKTLIALLFISTIAHAQLSIDAGLSSRMQGAFKAGYEQQTSWINTEVSAMVSTDNWHPVLSLQTGYSTTNDFQCANLRFQAGIFYHTALLPPDKEVRERCFKFGGSVGYELNHGTVGIEYNGETLSLTLGFIFKRKD